MEVETEFDGSSLSSQKFHRTNYFSEKNPNSRGKNPKTTTEVDLDISFRRKITKI
jgi:hypothetical protein